MDRLTQIAGEMVTGQTDVKKCLDELPQGPRRQIGAADDLLFSHRLRSMVCRLRDCIGPGGVGGPVAIMVPSGLICYVLWRLLCCLQPVWQGRPEESNVTLDEMVQKMMHEPAGGRQVCRRYHAGFMEQGELNLIARDVNEKKVSVVVVCVDPKTRIPAGALWTSTQVLCWSKSCGPTNGLL